jgi:hypothetical protein
VDDDHHAELSPERLLARLVAQQVLAHPGAHAAEQGGQQQRSLPHPPAVVTRLGLVEPEQAEGRQFREGEKDQRPVDDGQVDPAAQCA